MIKLRCEWGLRKVPGQNDPSQTCVLDCIEWNDWNVQIEFALGK